MKIKWLIITNKKNKIELNSKGERFKLACCDCGLTHDIGVALEKNGKIGLAFKRNEKITKKNRLLWKKDNKK